MKNLVFRMFFILGISTLLLFSCIGDNFNLDKLSDQVELRPTFVVPVATGSLTLANAIKPGENVVFDPDNLIRVIFKKDSVIYKTASELLEIPVQDPVVKVFNLTPLILNDFSQTRSVLLGELKDNMESSLKSFFEDNDGNNAIFPVVGPSSMGSYNVNLIDDFDYVYFTEGVLEVNLTNRLPVSVTITAEIRNQSDNTLVGSVTFNNIPSGAAAVQSSSLAGVRANNAIKITLSSFYTPGSNPSQVPINLNDDLLIRVEGKNMKVDRGRAIIPDQVVESEEQFVNIDLDENEQLYKVILSQGKISYTVNSAVSEGLYLSVVLPETRRNNQVVEYLVQLHQGGGGNISGYFDLTGTKTDLTKDPLQAYNRLPVNYEVGIAGSGQKIEFDLTGDDVNFTYTIEDLDFYYVEGWLGEKNIDVEAEEFDFAEDIEDFYEKFSGEIRLTNPAVRLAYDNSFGVPVRLSFNMTGYGRGAETVVLNPPVINFQAPADTLVGSVKSSVEINKDNSAIVDLIALPPKKIEFSGTALANPPGSPSLNFLKGSSSFKADLEVDIPLELQITNLSFSDTIEFEVGTDLDMIENAFMHFIVENGFPFELKLDFHFRDSVTGGILHSFSDIVIMEPAPVNTQGIVPEGQNTVSTEKIELTPAVLDKIKISNQLVVTARMSSSEAGTRPVKILSTYKMKFYIRVSSSLIIS